MQTTLNSTKNQSSNDYYGPLLTQHVRTILESGLLLDEDYEVLLKASNFKIYPVKATKLPLGLIASFLTTLGSVYVAKRYDLSFVVFPPITLTFGFLCSKIRSNIKRRKQREVTNYLVRSLLKVQKLNTTIIRYAKLRKELGLANEEEILCNQNIVDFIKLFIEKYQEYFKMCLDTLKVFANITEELSEDYGVLKQIDIEDILVCNYTSLNEFPIITSKVQDVYTLLTSKFLNYLAVTFCKNLRNNNTSKLEFLLNEKLPFIIATLDKLHDAVYIEFNNLRYCASKKIEIDTNNKKTVARHVSGKLQQTLIDAVNNLSIIMEKSRVILQNVETSENEKDFKKLENALKDLRDHAFATFESLDVLCKLYGIFSEANNVSDKRMIAANTQTGPSLNSEMPTVNFDDSSDAVEENYELFIPKTDTSNSIKNEETYVDQSGIYLNLMLKELRQSLKQHERFIAARDKRGIKDESEEISLDDVPKITKGKRRSPPKFDLGALQTKTVTVENSGDESLSNKSIVPSSSNLPPPAPPPPPLKLDMATYKDENNLIASQRTLFENIRALSTQIQGSVDVFKNEDCASDSDE